MAHAFGVHTCLNSGTRRNPPPPPTTTTTPARASAGPQMPCTHARAHLAASLMKASSSAWWVVATSPMTEARRSARAAASCTHLADSAAPPAVVLRACTHTRGAEACGRAPYNAAQRGARRESQCLSAKQHRRAGHG
jgi:hypothetical protein